MKSLKLSNENQDEIIVWEKLKKYPAWKRVVSILQKKADEADMVVNQIGGDRLAEYSKRDLAILKKNSYLDLIELPEKMITLLSGTGTEDVEELDPFSEEDEEN
jgi:hypothetical protein